MGKKDVYLLSAIIILGMIFLTNGFTENDKNLSGQTFKTTKLNFPGSQAEETCIDLVDGASYSGNILVCKKKYYFIQGIKIDGPSNFNGNNAEIIGPENYIPSGNYGVLITSDDVIIKNLIVSKWWAGFFTDPSVSQGQPLKNFEINDNLLYDNLNAIYFMDVQKTKINGNRITANLFDGNNVPIPCNGIVVSKDMKLQEKFSNNKIRENVIDVGELSTGILVGNDIAEEEKSFFNFIFDNTIKYIGCEDSGKDCYGLGIIISGLENSDVIGNKIDNFAGGSIQFDGQSNDISNNIITNIWGDYNGAVGIWETNQYKSDIHKLGNTIRLNRISKKPGNNGFIFGYQNYDVSSHKSAGGTILEGNVFNGLPMAYSGGQMVSNFGPNELLANNFINNVINIADIENTNEPLLAKYNYFSDHPNCNPQGFFCQNPYVWDYSQDIKPKADYWQENQIHTECLNDQCRVVEGPGVDKCLHNLECAHLTYLDCQGTQCVALPGIGIDQCQRHTDCQHLDCWGLQCTAVPGQGNDECASNDDCYYLGCQGTQCVALPGQGNDECASNDDCHYLDCQGTQCVALPGQGNDGCASNDDCYYLGCQGTQCVALPGQGNDECYTNTHCTYVNDPEWFVFTSTLYMTDGKIGLGGSDALNILDNWCNHEASTYSYPGIYKAWLSTNNVDAKDRLVDGKWVNSKGEIIAWRFDELLGGYLRNYIDSYKEVFTGTEYDGMGTNKNCNDWTSNMNIDFGTKGFASAVDKMWTNTDTNSSSSQKCVDKLHFYCFQIS
jgi:hypothetical protein